MEVEPLEEGTRVGRFVVLRDTDGNAHAVAAGSVAAMCSTDEGSVIMLSAGRMIQVAKPLSTLLAWQDGRS